MPEDWKRVRLGDYTTVKARLGWKGLMASEYLEDGFIFLSTPNLKGHQIDFENVNYISKWRFDESPEIQLREHDVLIVKDGSTLGTINFVRRLPCPATVNGSIAVVRTTGSLHPEFLYHFVNGEEFQKLIALKRSGLGVPHLFQADLREFPVSLPPLCEQRCIAEVLSTMDRAIEQTEALIAKQERIKAGLMQDLLICGIDEHGKLRSEKTHKFKDSLLGRIPATWGVNSFAKSWRASPQNGLYKPESAYGHNGTPIVRIDGFRRGDLIEGQVFRRVRLEPSELRSFRLQVDDILINRVNTIDLVGKSALVGSLQETTVFESNMMRLRLDRDRLLPTFAIFLLATDYAVRHFLRCAKPAIAQASINQADVGTLLMPFPPPSEQVRIVEHLRAISSLTKIEHSTLRLLTRLRTGLMQDLLTGHRRVTDLLEVPKAVTA